MHEILACEERGRKNFKSVQIRKLSVLLDNMAEYIKTTKESTVNY